MSDKSGHELQKDGFSSKSLLTCGGLCLATARLCLLHALLDLTASTGKLSYARTDQSSHSDDAVTITRDIDSNHRPASCGSYNFTNAS